MKNLPLCATVLLGFIFFAGCASSSLNPLEYKQRVLIEEKIPNVCKQQYESALPTVAVLDFVNNSTYGKADITSSNSRTTVAGFGGVGILPTGVFAGGVGEKKSSTNTQSRSVDAKLEQSIAPLIENMVLKWGGAKLYARGAIFDKVNEELKLQDSGIFDPKSIVEFGKMSGVKYIITGTIDNVEQRYIDNSAIAAVVQRETSRSKDDAVRIAGLIGRIATAATDGMIIKSRVTVTLIEVESAKILLSKQISKEINIGKIPNPSYDHIVGGIKKSINEAMPEIEKEFSNYFVIKGYITQIKHNGKEFIAQINLGKNLKILPQTELKIFSFDEIIDPMTSQASCDIITLPTKLIVTDQITDTHAWAKIDGDPSMLKIKQLVQKNYDKGATFGLFK